MGAVAAEVAMAGAAADFTEAEGSMVAAARFAAVAIAAGLVISTAADTAVAATSITAAD
jgi:hypothetical protein